MTPHMRSVKTTDKSSDKNDNSKLCCDCIQVENLDKAVQQMPTTDIDSSVIEVKGFIIPAHFVGEKQYQEFLAQTLIQVLEEHWTPARSKTLTWSETKGLWHGDAHVIQREKKVNNNIVRVVREKMFKKEFCGNFMRCTVQNSKPDIALEIVGKDNSNAILMIEVKFGEKPNEADCQVHIRQLIVYMITMLRPVQKPIDNKQFLLHGLLVYRAEAYMVTLKSETWLSFPWSCVCIKKYTFNYRGVIEVLRMYVRQVLGDGKLCKSQLFKKTERT
jgi:hypothetical protein